MTATEPPIVTEWIDLDEAPEWTDKMFDVAEFAIGRKVIRPAARHVGPDGVGPGSRPLRDSA